MATPGNQKELRLAFGVHREPQDAPAKVVRQIESEDHALRVSIRSGHHKLVYIAACVGKSVGYVSRLSTGDRPIPEKLVKPLCAATGSNLLAQYKALQAALEDCSTVRLVRLMREAA